MTGWHRIRTIVLQQNQTRKKGNTTHPTSQKRSQDSDTIAVFNHLLMVIDA